MAAKSGDPAGDCWEEEVETVVVRGEYAGDSDSDDVDVERYVFLARKPASAADGRGQAEDDVSSCRDGVDDDYANAMPGGEAGDERRGRKKRQIDIDASPSHKKARIGLSSPKRRPLLGDMSECSSPSRKRARISLTPQPQPPPAAAGPCGSEAVLLPCCAGAMKPECEEMAARGHARVPELEQEGEANNKKCRRSKSPEIATSDEGSRRKVAAAAADSAASRRFVCSECGRNFGSYQALGGHVLGHIRKSKNAAVAGATHHGEDVAGGNGNSNVEDDAVIAESDSHNEEEDTSPSSGESISEEEMAMAIVASPRQNDHTIHEADGNAKEKIVVRRRRRRNGDGNGGISARKTAEHKCELCHNMYLTGQALGGHIRKHRERPAHDVDVDGRGGGGSEGRSPSPVCTGDGETSADRHAAMIADFEEPQPPAQ